MDMPAVRQITALPSTATFIPFFSWISSTGPAVVTTTFPDGNIGTDNIGNRLGWDRPNNWNNPGGGRGDGISGWGVGGGGWGGNWHNHCINPRYGWYNGCHSGYWGSRWYAPLAWTSVGWGLGAMTSGWGYGTSYYNPYCVQPVATVVVAYDYSLPVVVNNYVSSDAESGDAIAQADQQTPESEQATKLFDDGLSQFKSGDYQAALGNFDAALQKLPGDPVVHEVRALTLFALGDYQSSAAALNSFLSSAPGMDWTTMSSLYGNVDDYQSQLRKLAQSCESNPNDPSSHFVLAYQYLATDSKDNAVNALAVVVKNQPKDSTARRMLDALAPPEPPPTRRRRQRLPAATHQKPTWSASGVPRRAIRRSIWRSPKNRNLPRRPRLREIQRCSLRGNWLRPAKSSSWKPRTRARWPAPSLNDTWPPVRPDCPSSRATNLPDAA